MNLNQVFNGHLDNLIRPEMCVGRYSWSAFQVCGCAGIALAIALALTLTTQLGLSMLVMTGIILSALFTFFAVILVTKIITGDEMIIYYHHEIAVMAVAAVLLWALGQPVLPYLDVTILCVGLLLACGRVGCLMVGCCHGSPHRWGVRYRAGHAVSGFPSYYVGVRLFPIQAVESLFVLGVVLAGAGIVLRREAPGEALAWYTVTYGLGRFCFEFMRGDPQRPYYLGLSQPQWISILLVGATICAELSGTISLHPWHLGVAAFLAVTVIAVSLRDSRKEITRRKLCHPRHLHEFAGAIQLASDGALEKCDMCKQVPAAQDIHIACTYLGVQVSASRIKRPTGHIHHYSICYQNGIMSDEGARLLTDFLLQIKHPFESSKLIKGAKDIFHLLVHTPADSVALQKVVDELRDGIEASKSKA